MSDTLTLDPASAALPPLQRLVSELARQSETKRDVMADTRRLSFAGVALQGFDEPGQAVKDEKLLVDLPDGAQGFGVTRHAHTQVADVVGVPMKLYDRLLGKHPALFEGLVNGLLAREPSRRMVRLLDGNVRAVLSDRYRPRDNWDLMQHLLPVLSEYPDVQFKECSLTEKRMYVKTFLPGIEIPVTPKVGDVIRGGVIFSNSEVGSGSLYVYPYTDRLICLNGMVHTDFGQRRIHVGKRIESTEEAYELYSDETMRLDDAAFFAKCADTVRACLTDAVFEQIAQQMRDLAAITVEGNPVAAVEILSKQHSLSGDEGDAMMHHLIQGGDLSAWAYVNAITATARDLEDADRRTELEMLAGRLTADPAWAVA